MRKSVYVADIPLQCRQVPALTVTELPRNIVKALLPCVVLSVSVKLLLGKVLADRVESRVLIFRFQGLSVASRQLPHVTVQALLYAPSLAGYEPFPLWSRCLNVRQGLYTLLVSDLNGSIPATLTALDEDRGMI